MKNVILFLCLSIHILCSSQTEVQQKSLAEAALELTKQEVTYDPSYFSIDYPNGDVPVDKGVCTDVVIRAYRKTGIDLQQLVHEDMKAHFHQYPNHWGLTTTDKNIDHRRVPNLMTFFSRKGAEQAITQNPNDYLPGDVVAWSLGGGLTHIGIVVNKKSRDGKRNLIVHNIGNGQVLEDCLFTYKIIGHYRYR
ncbi:DUF1287 domain-containing protein [Mesonia oceanica]|uniref:Uncharacterized protein n=1 Tax=Mesonia oceanica TaxID=2687242 RepID=A0AC61YAC3_9FLAO|nr:DUF1287 domain-containing protein [Mesonia oceanica]MAN29345.1 DUF1287 domain-containing protein [Mesonia sp.]MAQ41624.1 DUF1287 domain-containing protein [Mesonia sp.]VVV01462.1 hypothetical protein FVB9532_02754 [Mesonia oceanica]